MPKLINAYYNQNPWLYLLMPLSLLYQGIIKLRFLAYQKHIFKAYRFNVPIIIVGNITLGGTGKTPLVISLAQTLQQQGFKPGIVSRGYQADCNDFPLIVSEKSHVKRVGDEPYIIFQQTRCPVVIDPNRPRAVKHLLAHFDCNVILSDDGLQHYALQRDIEILVIDGERRFGNGFCLPAGPLREPISRCNRVDFIVSNSIAKENEYLMRLNPVRFINLQTKAEITIAKFTKQTVHAVAGIGNPQRFFKQLEALGFSVIPHVFADHHSFSTKDITFHDDKPVIMTEKDAVKCHEFAKQNHWYLQIKAHIDPNLMLNIIKRLEQLKINQKI